MVNPKISKEDLEVDLRLNLLGIKKEELIEVVHGVVAARNEVLAIDPINTSGIFAYIYGTRGLREKLLTKGWDIDRTRNVEAVINKEKGIKIIYQNTDSAADHSRSPRAISAKGTATKKIIDDGQMYMPFWEDAEGFERNTSVWFFCVSVNGEKVTAELSCPKSIQNNQFFNFTERIFIIQEGEWDTVKIDEDYNDSDEVQDFEISVTKK